MKGYLVLEDGTVLEGKAFGSKEAVISEIFFHTEMAGYENILTDPANAEQIITMTYPMLGSYGFNKDDIENLTSVPKGIVVKDYFDKPDHWKCDKTISEFLIDNNIFGLAYVDTRLLTRKIRDNGNMKCLLTVSEPTQDTIDNLKNTKITYNSVYKSSVKNYELYKKCDGKKVGILDLGSKKELISKLENLNCEIHIFPYNADWKNIVSRNIDLLIVSNGCADPYTLKETIEAINNLFGKVKVYGIGLGGILIAVASRIAIYKMKNGYRGCNYPILNKETEKVNIVSQNIGYGIIKDSFMPDDVEITYANVNDGEIEGFKTKNAEVVLFSTKGLNVLENWLGGNENAKIQ